MDFIKSKSSIVFIDWEIAESSSETYIEMRKRAKDSSIVDAIILATARINKAKLLSGGKHFKGLSDVIFLEDNCVFTLK